MSQRRRRYSKDDGPGLPRDVQKFLTFLFFAFTGGVFLMLSFRPDAEVNLDPAGGSYIITKSWWGLKKDISQVRLKGDQWQVRQDNGQWNELYIDDAAGDPAAGDWN